jgi:hypothetical protein
MLSTAAQLPSDGPSGPTTSEPSDGALDEWNGPLWCTQGCVVRESAKLKGKLERTHHFVFIDTPHKRRAHRLSMLLG